MLDYKPNIVLSNQEYKVVGTRPIRYDGVEKVTGQARYGADIRLPGMLYGKVLRSPHAHARIKAIDTRRAEACPGVYAVVTSADLVQHHGRITDISERTMNNLRFMSHNVLGMSIWILMNDAKGGGDLTTNPQVQNDSLR